MVEHSKVMNHWMCSKGFLVVFIVSLAFFVDQMLVTVTGPVLTAILTELEVEDDAKQYTETILRGSNVSTESTVMYNFELQNVTKAAKDSNVKARLGLLLSSKGIVQIVVNPFSGYSVDRFGPIKMLVLGAIIDGICAFMYAFGQSYELFFAARSIHGLATSISGTSGLGIIAETFSTTDTRGRWLGLVNAVLFLGGSLGPFYGGAMHQFCGQVVAFTSLVPLLAIVMLLCWPLSVQRKKMINLHIVKIEECEDGEAANVINDTEDEVISKPDEKKLDGEEKEEKGDQSQKLLEDPESKEVLSTVVVETVVIPKSKISRNRERTPIWRLLMDPYIVIIATGLMVINLSHNCLMATISLWMLITFESEEWQQGVVFLPSILFHIIGTVFSIWLCSKYPQKRHIFSIGAMLLSAVANLALPFLAPWMVISVSIGLIMMSVAIGDVTLLPLLNKVVDARHIPKYGSVSAIAYSSFSTAAVLGSAIAGIVYQVFGFHVLNYGLAALCVLYSPLLIFLRRYCDE